MSQWDSRRTVIEGWLHDRKPSGLGWVVDDVQVEVSDREVNRRVYLGTVVLEGYKDRRVRIVIEEIESEDKDEDE